MSEKIRNAFAVIGICLIVFVIGGTIGFFLGSRSVISEIGQTDQQFRIEQQIAEDRIARDQERLNDVGDMVQDVAGRISGRVDRLRELNFADEDTLGDIRDTVSQIREGFQILQDSERDLRELVSRIAGGQCFSGGE